MRGRRALILVFGESEHDRRALVELVRGLRPDLRDLVEERRRPLVLIKGTLPSKARSNAEEIAALARVEQRTRNVLAVLAHEDCDAIEPAHAEVAEKIEAELRAAGCPGEPIGAAPAWETETWWMVFPEAVGKIVEGWRDPDDWLGRDVGRVEWAKEKLAAAVQPRPRPRKGPPRPYEERDSISVARNIVQDDLLRSFADGRRTTPARTGTARVETRSASLERFRTRVLAIRHG